MIYKIKKITVQYKIVTKKGQKTQITKKIDFTYFDTIVIFYK